MAAKNKTVADQAHEMVNDNDMESVMEYSQDLSDAERPEPLPVGEYAVTIIRASKKVSKSGSERPYLEVLYQVSSDDMPADYHEKWQRDNVSIVGRHFILEDTPLGRYNAKRFCEGVGLPLSNRLPINELVGLTCRINVNHQDDLEGLPRENLQGLPKKA